MAEAEVRSCSDIIKIIENAKLHPDDLHSTVQQIHFHGNFGSSERRLLELDPEVEKCLREGDSVILRGLPDESAMLCTPTSTFELKEAETSNSLLLVDRLSFPPFITEPNSGKPGSGNQQNGLEDPSLEIYYRNIEDTKILGVAHSYLEMRRVKPHLGKLIQLLEPTSYQGIDHEYEIDKTKLVTMKDILNQVPASEAEIKTYLENLKVLEIKGYLRLVDSMYLLRVLKFIADIIDENSWSSSGVVKETVIAQLNQVEPAFVLEKVFQWFFLRSPSHSSDLDEPEALCIDEELYGYNEEEICRLHGEVLLKRGDTFNYKEFLKFWQDSVPRGLKVHRNQLKDISVIDETKSPATIRLFPEYNLPIVTQDRLSVLFAAKPKWKHDEIMPFIANLAVTEQAASVLLTKFCRVTSPEGVKTYSARYVK